MCALAGRGATARARNSARSPVVNPLQHGAGGVVHHDVAPRQYPPRDLEEPVPAHAGAARATPGEWGDVLGRPHVVEDVRAGADHGPGAEQRADRRLRMVADQAAEQLQPGLETRPRDLETHATVCVLQVRRDRAGAEVRPAADHAMADEAVVRLVRVPQEDAARQLAARTGPPSTWAFAPTHKGPSSRAPARTSAPLSSTTGPFRTSKTTPGSTAASRSAIAAGSPITALPGGSGSLSPSKARRSSGSSCSSAGTRSYTPRSTTPGTSIAAAWGWGPSHVAPGPTPHPTVTPPLVSRKAPFGSAGASPRGAKVEEPITAGPGTGRRAATRGTPASANPAR